MRKPPLMPFLLLKYFAPGGMREFFLGDIEEEFQMLVSEQGRQKANRWFWKQTLNSLIPLIKLTLRKNFELSPFRLLALLSIIVPVIITQPLKSSPEDYFSLYHLLGLLFSSSALGFLCRLIISKGRFLTSVTAGLIIFTILLAVRGDAGEIPWLIILVFIFVSGGAGLAFFVCGKNSPDPKIRT